MNNESEVALGMLKSSVIGSMSIDELLTPELKKLAEDRLANDEVLHYLLLFGSQHRTLAFAHILALLSLEQQVTLAREVWIIDDNPSANFSFWRKMLGVCRNYPEQFMVEVERQALASLPEVLTVFRGASPLEARPKGLAWTLDPSRADFFAYHYPRGGRVPGHVFSATVKRRQIIGLLSGRDESEVLLFPQSVRDSWTISSFNAHRA